MDNRRLNKAVLGIVWLAVGFILAMIAFTPVHAEITNGACSGTNIGLGTTCTATGFLNESTGLISDPTSSAVFKVQDLDCGPNPRQAEIKVTPFWAAVGSFPFDTISSVGQVVTLTNPADSQDFIQYTVSGVFCGGEGNLGTLSPINYQQTFHVDPSGNDANNGNKTSLAWKTVTHAMDEAFDGVDIQVASGVYSGISSSSGYGATGLSNAPIVLRTDGSYPQIKELSIGGQYAVLSFNNPSYLDIYGFKLNNSQGNVFYQRSATAGATSNGVKIHDNIINASGQSLVINQPYGSLTTYSGWQYYNNTMYQAGIYVLSPTVSPSNLVYNNTFLASSANLNNNWYPDSGTIGNYWILYTGVDNNGDSIGDTSYPVGGRSDAYPKMDRESGTVYDNVTHNPIVSAMVNQSGATYRGTITDGSGHYALSTIGRNTVTLTGHKATYTDNISTGTYNSNALNLYLNPALGAPTITGWTNSITNDNKLVVSTTDGTAITFTVTGADQAISVYNWFVDGNGQAETGNAITKTLTPDHTSIVTVTAQNANGVSAPVQWSVSLSANIFDPDGYINDDSGKPIQGAKVVISNATYTDACILTSCYSDANGRWAGTIYADGNYILNASKQGYLTSTTTQALTVGGTASNLTLTAGQATLSGHVYTTISGTGTTAIKGQLQDLRVDSCGVAGQGGTLTIGTSGDGHLYVLKLIDVDSGNQQSLWQLLKDGAVLYNNQLVNTNQVTQLKIYETFYESVYVDIRVSNVFQGASAELNTATTCGSFEHVKKSPSVLDWLFNVAKDIVMGLVFGSGSTPTVLNFNDVFASTDGSNTNAVTFNATAGKDSIGYADFNVNNPATINNFNMALTAESLTGNAGKLEIGYTDNTQTNDNGFTDTILINSKQSCQNNMQGYCTPQHDFKAVDANSDGTIRVWFKFDSGYSNFKMYEFYLNAWGTTTQTPLQGVSVYSLNGTNTTTTDVFGAYTLFTSLINNTVIYTKIGYQTKNYTFLFNSTNVSFTQDVVLNATNGTINTSKEYIIVPNFVQGVATNGNYKTLSHTSLIGGYQICVSAQLGTGECIQKIDVPANTEGTFALDQGLGVGTYEADLTGYLGGLLDIHRVVIVATNFTVTSSSPHVNWAKNPYYLGDKMVLSIYVPTSSQNVHVVYLTNGTQIYNNTFSATGTVQNVSFQTLDNLSLNPYPPGQYQGCIDGGNCDTTTLNNQSANIYTVSAPSSVVWGTTFNINYVSPSTSLLQISDSNNNILSAIDVVGNAQSSFDTSQIANVNAVLTIQLIRNGQVVATANTTIQPGQTTPGGTISTTTALGIINVMTNIAFWGFIVWIGTVASFAMILVRASNGGNFNTGVLVYLSGISATLIALTGLFGDYKLFVLAFVWIAMGIYWRMTRDATIGG